MIEGRYTRIAILLHWLIAILILANLALPTLWENFAPDDAVRPLINLHKSFGISVFGLAAMRLLWRVTHTPPPFPEDYKRWETRLAHVVHISLYLFMFMVPLAGWIMDSAWKDAAKNPIVFYGAIPFPRLAPVMNLDPVTKLSVHNLFELLHGLLAYILLALIVLHIAGAVKHQWIDRRREIQRMWFRR